MDRSSDSPATTEPSCSQALTFDQLTKLDELLKRPVAINSMTSLPHLQIAPLDLVKKLRTTLREDGIVINDVRLNGSAASYCVADERLHTIEYQDLDLIFQVEICSEREFYRIKDCVLRSLQTLLPAGSPPNHPTLCGVEEAYVHKQVKVNSCQNRWSLISLHNSEQHYIELKFVGSMSRQYQFSTDSFQIILDSYFNVDGLDCVRDGRVELKATFFPSVRVVSAYGDYSEAEYHLNHKLIRTKNPEEIRGGGLFKYCRLLSTSYKPYDVDEMELDEAKMCTRFFIDFPDLARQSIQLHKYFYSHYNRRDPVEGLFFLQYLLQVVQRSSRYARDAMQSNFENYVNNYKLMYLLHSGLYQFVKLVPATNSNSYRSLARKSSSNSTCGITSPSVQQRSGNSFPFAYGAIPTRVPTPPGSYGTPISPYMVPSAIASGTSNL